ncbi:MAG: glycerophosphodiester phosphodiesterase family protein [PVC group bacterium]
MLSIAHRGASAVAPENTLAAFREAVRVGADLIELDLRLSRDQAVVVFHDRDLSRTTDGAGPVEERTLAELKRLDAGGYFSADFAGEKIPTLEEVIREIAPGRIGLCVELKIDAGREEARPELVRRVLKIVERERFQNRVMVASFDREAVRLCRTVRPAIRTGLIFSREEAWKECADDGYSGLDVLSARWNIITAPRVAAAHRAGREVIAWTIDRKSELERVARCFVDGVASNNPAWLIETLSKNKPGE